MKYKFYQEFESAPKGIKPKIETPVSVVDCNATTMSMASGGEYVKRDKIHLDKNAIKQTHDSIVPPRDIFEADSMVRGLGSYILSQRESVQVDSDETVNAQPVVEPTPAEPTLNL